MNTSSPSTVEPRVVRVERLVDAAPPAIFELIADPARQPRWDGMDNLEEAAPGQRLQDEGRFDRARATTAERLRASLDRLAEVAEGR